MSTAGGGADDGTIGVDDGNAVVWVVLAVSIGVEVPVEPQAANPIDSPMTVIASMQDRIRDIVPPGPSATGRRVTCGHSECISQTIYIRRVCIYVPSPRTFVPFSLSSHNGHPAKITWLLTVAGLPCRCAMRSSQP